MHVVFATMKSYEGLEGELAHIVKALETHGITATTIPLQELQTKDCNGIDAVILQTTSGYHLDLPRFLTILDQLEARGVTLLNSASVVHWNSDKHYLLDLAQQGHALLPTLWLEAATDENIQNTLLESGWNDVVVKPCVSAGAHLTRRFQHTEFQELVEWLTPLLKTQAFMIQPFAPEIQATGEYSLIFFNGQFSHAVLKLPQTGDYRVQHVHGGSYEHLTPPPSMLQAAEDVLNDLPGDTLYARVDGIVRDEQFLVMEVEVIEPFLYLLPDQANVTRFAAALAEKLHPVFRKVS